MKVFRKALLALSAVSFFFLSQVNGDNSLQPTCAIQRVVTWQKVRNIALEGLFNPVDPLHQGLLTSGLPFDQAFVDAMDATAIQNFNDAYGIDFSDTSIATYDPTTGIYSLNDGSAIMIPYLNNPPCEDVYVTSDSLYPGRVGKWIQISFGRFVIFLGNGTINNSSPNNGAQFQSGSLWFYGYTTFVKKGSDFSKPGHLELIPLMSYQLGEQFPNQWTNQTGLLDILVPMTILDAQGNNTGIAIFPSNALNIPQGSANTTYFLYYGYYQWPGINCLPPNCLAP